MLLILRTIKKLIFSLLLLFVLLGGIFVFLLTSTPGLFLTMKLASAFMPGTLHVVGIKADTPRRISAQQVSYADNALQLKIKNLNLNWRLRDLWRRKLTIKQLQIEAIDLQLLEKPSQTEAKTSTNAIEIPKLPIDIAIEALKVNTLHVSNAASELTLTAWHAQATLSKAQWQINNLDFTFHNHTIALKALAETSLPYAITASLQIKNLKKINPGLDGHIDINGNLLRYQWQGQISSPAPLLLQGSLIKANELHSNISWGSFKWPLNKTTMLSFENGKMTIDGIVSNLALHLVTNLTSPTDAALKINAKTNPNGMTAQALITSKLGTVDLNLLYDKKQKPKLQGSLNAGALSNVSNDSLIKSITIKSQFKGSALEELILTSQISALYQNTRLNATVNYQQQQLNAAANLGANRLQLSSKPTSPWTLTTHLPEPNLLYPALKGLSTTITVDGTLTNREKADLTLKISKGKFESQDKLMLPFEGGVLRILLDDQQLQATGKFALDATKNLNLSLNLPKFHYDSDKLPLQKITGSMRLHINSLVFLNDLNPAISNAQGELLANLNVKGSISKPIVDGTLALNKASVSLPKMGITLNPVQFALKSHDKKWDAKGALVSNGNALTIEGSGDFYPIVKGLLTINGNGFPILNTSEYLINISPKFNFEFGPSLLKINGSLLIPKAEIKPQTFTDTVSLTDDAVFVNKAPPPPNPYNLDTDVTVEMGNDVALAVKGLQGFLIGSIKLRQFPDKPLTASGELNVRDGKYKAYGQDLTIEQGQLLFTGGQIDNPGIRIRAVRKFNNATSSFEGTNQLFDFNPENLQTIDLGNKTTVGIEVVGRLTSPKIQLFSIPSNLSQADILSLLLLGKPANQASKSGGQLLLTAVSALNLNSGTGGTQLLQQLKQNLGIDFNLENNTQYDQKTNQSTDNTAFVVGKALSKRLYVSYNMGLSQADNNVLTLKYLLNKFFSIQINTSVAGSGIDLLYTHKKD